MWRLFSRVLLVVVLGLVVGACSEEAGSFGSSGAPTLGGFYRVSLDFNPTSPLPDLPANARVEVTRDGQPLEGASVSISARSEGQSLGATALVGAGGGLYVGDVTLKEGAWIIVVTVEPVDGERDLAEFAYFVSCTGDGSQGSVCCGADACGDGLSCVYGTCATDLAVEGGGCFDHTECGTANCEDSICMPEATCTDGRVNGGESDLDCGGACDPCLEGGGCNTEEDCAQGSCIEGVCVEGLPLLGNGGHLVDNVEFTVVSGSEDRHQTPTDLEFHPVRTDELWVLSKADHSMWIATGIGTPSKSGFRRSDVSGAHFMANPTAFAFGDKGCISNTQNQPSPLNPDTESLCMATIHEEDQTTPFTDNAPGTFMGPTLFTADSNRFDGGHSSHYDMLHNSPNGMGIAWESGNAYWIFDGFHASLTRYEFAADHGPGGQFHDDGVVTRYVEGEVSRVEGVPSHMAFDPDTDLLYVADTGNNRIAVLNTTTGNPGSAIFPNYDQSQQFSMNGATLTTFIDGSEVGLERPSGLELHDGMLFVTDNKTSRVLAFTLEGELIDFLNTGLPEGSLMGLTFDVEGRLYLTDAVGNQVHRVAPR